jgi:hypothetical protein
MVSDSSKVTEERIDKVLVDNDLGELVVNASKVGIYAFPYFCLLESLNTRVSVLEAKVNIRDK